jgi:glycosyltransferase involved in cell wall biosynthesis
MRIGFHIYGSLDLVSGGFIYDRLLIEALRQRGHEVRVIGLPWPRTLAGALVQNALPWPDRRAVDVVVQDELIHPAVFFRNARLGAPVVALVHNLGGQRRAFAGALERAYLRGVAGVVAVSQDTLDQVRRAAGAGPAVLARAGREHLSSTVDEDAIEARSAESGPLRLLLVGTVMAHKGLLRLIEALPEGVSVDVAGSLTADPAYVAAVRRAIERLRAPVRLHDELRGAPLWALYRRAQLFVQPSDSESYSLAALEAMAHGLPVLTTPVGGMAEMITAGVEGLLIDPLDRGAWSEALTRLARDRTTLSIMGRRARARFAVHGTWADAAAAVEGLLAEVVGR